ncbi:hypothetical protein [Aneurinibacillus uraniidurans]|uniref:hypothetical protein n=1 Tax=Aneurinibacillus uraniidurans TaxID=2966586 RepID=UPI00234AF6CD|nr:hypothetical protein [Aneurinibacillus sp. B1]WCN38437.1 hypothetical protein PO771_03295 [Aneurinibacillus sp. B1]
MNKVEYISSVFTESGGRKMALEKKLRIAQMIVSVVVLVMSTINLLSSPEHNYIPVELISFFLGISMTIQGIMLIGKKEQKWLVVFSFVVAAVSFYAAWSIFFTRVR